MHEATCTKPHQSTARSGCGALAGEMKKAHASRRQMHLRSVRKSTAPQNELAATVRPKDAPTFRAAAARAGGPHHDHT